jgi:hypothetical protein
MYPDGDKSMEELSDASDSARGKYQSNPRMDREVRFRKFLAALCIIVSVASTVSVHAQDGAVWLKCGSEFLAIDAANSRVGSYLTDGHIEWNHATFYPTFVTWTYSDNTTFDDGTTFTMTETVDRQSLSYSNSTGIHGITCQKVASPTAGNQF